MKKKIKIAAISLAVLVLVFLSLPFFAPKTTSNSKAGENAQQNTPQIFTSNPLSEMVNRIAALFGKKNAVIHSAGGMQNANSNAVAEEMLADARAAAANTPTTEETPKAGEEGPFGSFFGDGEEEWVLAPQFSPEGTTRGMHEISVKGDAYDNYIRAERAARFTPAAINPRTKEVPNSKLARIFNPIKRFFGFDDPYATDSDWYVDDEAARLAYVQGDKESAKDPRQFNRAGATDMNDPNISLGNQNVFNGNGEGEASFDENEVLSRVLSLVYPELEFESKIEKAADARFGPPPHSPEQRKQRDNYIRKKLSLLKERNREISLEALNEKKEAELEALATPSIAEAVKCNNKSLKSSSTECPWIEDKPQPIDGRKKEEIKQKNAKDFPVIKGTTNYTIPITVVFGQEFDVNALTKTIGENLTDEVDPDIDPESLLEKKPGFTAQKMYHFMTSKANCDENNPCFWVAAAKQEDFQLNERIDMAGKVTFKGDPLNRYAQIQEEYIQNLPEQLTAQFAQSGMSEEEIKDKIKEETEYIRDFSPAYVLYTQTDLQAWHRQNLENLKNRNGKEVSIAYTSTTKGGESFINAGLSPIIGGNAIAVSEDLGGETLSQEFAAEQIAKDTVDYLNRHLKARDDVDKILAGETIQGSLQFSEQRGESTPAGLVGDRAAADQLLDGRRDVGTYQRD